MPEKHQAEEQQAVSRPLSEEATALAAEIVSVTDPNRDVDWATLARLDDMPEEDAAKALDEIMSGLVFD